MPVCLDKTADQVVARVQTTRVSEGVFMTEDLGPDGTKLQEVGMSHRLSLCFM